MAIMYLLVFTLFVTPHCDLPKTSKAFDEEDERGGGENPSVGDWKRHREGIHIVKGVYRRDGW